MNKNTNQTREDKLNTAILSLLANVVESHSRNAERIAEAATHDDSAKAKMAISLEWDAGSNAPKILAKVSYAVRYKDEFEVQEHFDQTTLKFEKKLI